MTSTRPPLLARVLREVDRTDLAVYRAIARSPTPTLDDGLKRLTHAADRSMLWLSIAAVLGLVPGAPRRAAVSGATSIAVSSVVVNVVAKTLVPRTRPDRLSAVVPRGRLVRMPKTTSFPSGHSASAFAFATAVGAELPAASLPLHVLATAVAYSRVHTGVHYPTDAIIGAAIGASAAAGTSRLTHRLMARQRLAPR